MNDSLSKNEFMRYSRQFPLIGLKGQQRLKNSKVICIGGGGLGCSVLPYLAGAGIGTLCIVDGDKVEISNLHRQILFTESDVGAFKAACIARYLKKVNSNLQINYVNRFLTTYTEGETLLNAYDIVIDATDNFQARYLLNDLCRNLKKPLVSASIYQFEAQLGVFNYQEGPCYQCLYSEPPPINLIPNCAVGGVLGVIPGVIGVLQANETIKICLGKNSDVLSGILLTINLSNMQFAQLKIEKQDCANHHKINFDTADLSKDNALLKRYTAGELALYLKNQSHIQLLDVRLDYEHEICNIGGILIPLSELQTQISLLNKHEPIIVYCKSGARSMQACQLLLKEGYTDVGYLEGGILAWIKDVNNQLIPY